MKGDVFWILSNDMGGCYEYVILWLCLPLYFRNLFPILLYVFSSNQVRFSTPVLFLSCNYVVLVRGGRH